MKELIKPSEKEQLKAFQEGFNEGLARPISDSLNELLRSKMPRHPKPVIIHMKRYSKKLS